MVDAQDTYGTRLTDLHYLSHPPSPTQTVTKKPSIWILLFSALLGGLGSYIVFSLLLTPSLIREIKSLHPLQDAAVLLSIPIAIWTAIFIHETGHLCAGMLAGMKPIFLLAGPLKVSFENSKLNIHLNKVFSTWGGLALATPREGSYPAMMRNDLIFPIVIHIVEHFRDTSLAEQWMSLCNGSTYYKYMELLAKATIAEANGDHDASRSLANEALNNLPSTHVVPPKRIERLKQLTSPTT